MNMIQLANAQLTLSYWRDGAWSALALARGGDAHVAQGDGIRATLRLADVDCACYGGRSPQYELSFRSERPTRLQLKLSVPDAVDPFHLIPANIFGDNNLSGAEPGHYPNLTNDHPGNVSCSPYWELRADRASHPISILCFRGGIAGVSIDPFSDVDDTEHPDGFIRNGVFSQLAHEGEPNACGVTLGYGNQPRTFLNKDQWGPPTEHLSRGATARGRIFIGPAASRLDAHRLIRINYDTLRDTPETPISLEESVAALTNAFLTINWQPDKENFSNMRCADPAKKVLTAWRTLAEVGWTGGGVIGDPLLVAGHVLRDPIALQRGIHMLDWVARAYNPASGLLWDVCGRHEGRQLNWWWAHYVVEDCHCAYTNGSGVYYLLKSYLFAKNVLGDDRRQWLATALKVLDTMAGIQEPDGNFGYTYSAQRPQILDRDGFVGVWFVPAMVMAHQLTGARKYLDAATRGICFYHEFVKDLNCWGAPMDTWKAVDQEGNLGFIRGAQLLHQATGDDAYLEMLIDGAHYEYLWRYAYRARPECPPLKGSHWNSCGGSVTSTSNPHIHPMGVFVSSELRYLAARTGDAYHAQRFEDGVNWGINCVSLYPEVAGYGIRGVLTERFCPSDGLLIEQFPDGTPSSMWFSYNGWAAAAVLEGLAELKVSGPFIKGS